MTWEQRMTEQAKSREQQAQWDEERVEHEALRSHLARIPHIIDIGYPCGAWTAVPVGCACTGACHARWFHLDGTPCQTSPIGPIRW